MTTPTREQACAHDQIQSGHFEDGTGHVGIWWCNGCGLKFVPITESMAARAQALDDAAAKVRAILKQCEDDDVNDPPLEFTAAQIEALKGKQ